MKYYPIQLQIIIPKRKLENSRIELDERKNTVKRVKLNHDSNNNNNNCYHCYNIADTIHVLSDSIDKLSICLTPKKENIDASHVNIQTETKTSGDGVFQLTIRLQSMDVE